MSIQAREQTPAFFYMIRPSLTRKGYELHSVMHGMAERIGTYPTKKSALTAGKLLAGYRFPVFVQVR